MTTDSERRASERPAPDHEVIAVRRGLFGAKGSGDTSGYGGLVRPVTLAGASARPYGGYFDEIADTSPTHSPIAAVRTPTRSKVVIYRDEMTLHIRRRHLPVVAQTCATIRGCDSNCVWASTVCTIPTTPNANCTPAIHSRRSRTAAASVWKLLSPTRSAYSDTDSDLSHQRLA